MVTIEWFIFTMIQKMSFQVAFKRKFFLANQAGPIGLRHLIRFNFSNKLIDGQAVLAFVSLKIETKKRNLSQKKAGKDKLFSEFQKSI